MVSHAVIHLKTLITLANSDDDFSPEEKGWVYTIAFSNGVSKEEVDALMVQNHDKISYDTLGEAERVALLFSVVQLMKIDRKLHAEELAYCERLAGRLGYKKGVIRMLSQRIYADPNISFDRKTLEKAVKGYLLKGG